MPAKKILVVEDESVVALHIKDSLQKLGYKVPAMASTGADAVRKAEEVAPDLVLMDIVLKGDMDGIEAADLIHAKMDIPVIYVTAYGDEATLQRAKVTEPFGYILKPFKERELHTAIEISLYKSSMERQLKKMERWLSTTLRSIGDAVIATDEEGYITFMNKVAEDMTGWKQENALGKKLAEIFHLKNGEILNTQTVEDILIKKVLREGVIMNLVEEHVLTTKDRKEIPIIGSIAPIREEKDQIPGIVLVFRDITERKILEETIRYQSFHDSLTGLPNRLLFTSHIEVEIAHAKRNRKKLAVIFLDLDRFKSINDTLGHHIGDKLLLEVADRLRSSIRETDIVARTGGDEFNMMLSNIGNATDAGASAEKLTDVFKKPFIINGYELNVSASMGISIYPDDAEHIGDLMKQADIAMYQAKERGRNNYQFFDPAVNVRTLERITLENRMRQAIQRGELEVVYQPMVDIAGQRVTCAEALVRWRHPEMGLLDPAQFLNLAEESGFIRNIDAWVLETACKQNAQWQKAGLPPICMSVNLSAQQWQREDLAGTIMHALDESGLDPRYLCIEITENVAMSNLDLTIPNVNKLADTGISLSIDDFGTGYSSLSCLRKFRIQRVKVDKSFVSDIAVDSDTKAIINAIIAMSHTLKLKVVAEGVENREQIEFLRSIGCDEIQGNLFSRPVPAEQFNITGNGFEKSW